MGLGGQRSLILWRFIQEAEGTYCALGTGEVRADGGPHLGRATLELCDPGQWLTVSESQFALLYHEDNEISPGFCKESEKKWAGSV